MSSVCGIKSISCQINVGFSVRGNRSSHLNQGYNEGKPGHVSVSPGLMSCQSTLSGHQRMLPVCQITTLPRAHIKNAPEYVWVSMRVKESVWVLGQRSLLCLVPAHLMLK